MADKTTIEWTDATWSPLRVRVRPDAAEIARAKGYTSLVQIAEKTAGQPGQHCEHVSDGCKHCWSETWQARCLKVNGTGLPFDRRSRDLVEPYIDERSLLQPLHWKTPKRIFVEDQSDLFGEWWPDEMIMAVWRAMGIAQRHTFQVLTKRSKRALELLPAHRWRKLGPAYFPIIPGQHRADDAQFLPNVHLGVSVEDDSQKKRIEDLLRTPAAVRWVSYEPALGPVEFDRYLRPYWSPVTGADPPPWLDWLVIGGESGPGARPFDLEWARRPIAQCGAAGVPVFMKQVGARPFAQCAIGEGCGCDGKHRLKLKKRKGNKPAEWPEDINVRQYPGVNLG